MFDLAEERSNAALRLVAASLADVHPVVRVAAAAAITQHDRLLTETSLSNPVARAVQARRPNPLAQAILDDAVENRSDEVAEVAAAVRGRPFWTEHRATVETGGSKGPARGELPAARADSALVHGTWARKQRLWKKAPQWWRPSGDFHDFLVEDYIFPLLYAGPKPFEWSGYYSLRMRLPGLRADWSRLAAGGKLAWWSHKNLDCPAHLIGHSYGGSVAMLATHEEHNVQGLILLSPAVHPTCLPNPDYYRRALVVRAKLDLVLAADQSSYKLLDHLPRLETRWVRRKGLAGHQATHTPVCWRDSGLDGYVRDHWLPQLATP